LFFKSALLALLLPLANAGIIVPQAGIADHVFVPTSDRPIGHNITIDGITTYVSLPPSGRFDKSVAVLHLMDVFGFPKTDNALLADNWARAGFATYLPDYLFGDPLPQDGSVPIATWLASHGENVTLPIVLNTLKFLKKIGVKKVAVTGYCFGGLYATRLAQDNLVVVSTMAHPSLLTVPDDAEILQKQSRVPVQINSGDLDTAFTPALGAEYDSILVGFKPGYSRTAWAGVGHGFAVSANTSDPVAVAAKQGAFDVSLNWIKTHLKH